MIEWCSCELRDRKWDPMRGRCRTCGLFYDDPRYPLLEIVAEKLGVCRFCRNRVAPGGQELGDGRMHAACALIFLETSGQCPSCGGTEVSLPSHSDPSTVCADCGYEVTPAAD